MCHWNEHKLHRVTQNVSLGYKFITIKKFGTSQKTPRPSGWPKLVTGLSGSQPTPQDVIHNTQVCQTVNTFFNISSKKLHRTVRYSVPQTTWHSGEIFHLVRLSSHPCYLWFYRGKHAVRVLSATCCSPFFDVHPQANQQVLRGSLPCAYLGNHWLQTQNTTDAKQAVCSTFDSISGKSMKFNQSFHYRRYKHSSFYFCLWQFRIQVLNLLECITPCVNLFNKLLD